MPGIVRLGHLLWCSVLVFLNGFCPIWQWFRPPSSVPGPVGSRCAQHRLASTHAPVRCFGAPSKGCPPTMATAVSCHPSQKANGNPVHRAFVVVARVGHAWRDATQGGGQCHGGIPNIVENVNSFSLAPIAREAGLYLAVMAKIELRFENRSDVTKSQVCKNLRRAAATSFLFRFCSLHLQKSQNSKRRFASI